MDQEHETPVFVSTMPRPFTVQCSFATWHARTVVVEARSLEEACERAIEAANESDGWRAIDDCGPTFVDAVAEGEDVDLWSVSAPRVPIPIEFAEHGEAEALRAALRGLLDWAAVMGGWESEAWRAAERAVGNTSRSKRE